MLSAINFANKANLFNSNASSRINIDESRDSNTDPAINAHNTTPY